MIRVRDNRYHPALPALLMPTGAGPFPFDRDSLTLWQECNRGGWEVDDWLFEFTVFGAGARRFLVLAEIRGTLDREPFRLRFFRPEGRIEGSGQWNRCTGVSTICLPRENGAAGMVINVFEDLSGPRVVQHVEKEWSSRTADEFYSGSHVNSKLRNQPRTYLLYTDNVSQHDSDGHAVTLPNDTDLGREYAAEFPEPLALNVASLYGRARDYVRRLARRAESVPTKPRTVQDLCGITPESAPQLVLRTNLSRHNLETLTGFEGWRLCDLGVYQTENKFPDRAWDGFTYCVASPLDPTDRTLDLSFSSDDTIVVEVTPKNANDIFVVDYAPANEWRAKLWEDHTRLTNDELQEFYRIRARTMVPLSAYKGGYGSPVYLIGRDLAADELRPLHAIESPRVKVGSEVEAAAQ